VLVEGCGEAVEGEEVLGRGEMGTWRYLGDLPGGRRGGKREGFRGSDGGGGAAEVVGGWMGRVDVAVEIIVGAGGFW
jgi:hypothetical protein